MKLKLFTEMLIAFIVTSLLLGCPQQTLDPALYPADWPLVEITAPEGSTPAKFPQDYLDQVPSVGQKSDHAYSTSENVPYKGCGICFNNPGNWDQVLKDINRKCGKEGWTFAGDEGTSNPKLIVKSGAWADMGGGGSIWLHQTSENSYILEVSFWPNKGLKLP